MLWHGVPPPLIGQTAQLLLQAGARAAPPAGRVGLVPELSKEDTEGGDEDDAFSGQTCFDIVCHFPS